MQKEIQLSASKLNIFLKCDRCFYDGEVLKNPRPRGIFPSLPGGIDLVLKPYFDQYRGKLPPLIQGSVMGVLFDDKEQLKRWRHWKTGLVYYDREANVRFIGALDDCLVYNNRYIPLDYKTKGSEPKDDGSQYYQNQLDCYNLMLKSNGYEILEIGYLTYVWPVKVIPYETNKNTNVLLFDFDSKTFRIPCSSDRAVQTIRRAAELLRGDRPEASRDCEYCNYRNAR